MHLFNTKALFMQSKASHPMKSVLYYNILQKNRGKKHEHLTQIINHKYVIRLQRIQLNQNIVFHKPYIIFFLKWLKPTISKI